jgi:hypothetical protein
MALKTAAEANDVMSPSQVASRVGRRPQEIFSMVSKGKIQNHALKGEKTRVSLSEVQRYIATLKPRAYRDSTGGLVRPTNPSLRKGRILSWDKVSMPPEVNKKGFVIRHQRVVQVERSDSVMTYLRDVCGQGKGGHITYDTNGLYERLKKDEIRVESPWDLLNAVALQWENDDKPKLAGSLRKWINKTQEALGLLTKEEEENVQQEPELAPTG